MYCRAGVCGHCGKTLGDKALKEHRRLYYHEGQWLKEDHENQQDIESNCSSPMYLSDPESENSFQATGSVDYYSDNEDMETFQSPELQCPENGILAISCNLAGMLCTEIISRT